MPRRPRIAPDGLVYHVLNRGLALFEKDADNEAFAEVMAEAMEKHATRLLGYQVMPNRWHLVLWPKKEGELTAFVRWLTHTHVMRWHAHYGTSGSGHRRLQPLPRDRPIGPLGALVRLVADCALASGFQLAVCWRP